MDVSQVINLSQWYIKHSDEFIEKYSELHSILHQNAHQPTKLPVREPLKNLIDVLERLPLNRLTNEEIDKLDSLGILQYLGKAGSKFVSDTIIQEEFDPASASQDIQLVIEVLSKYRGNFEELDDVLREVEFFKSFDEEVVGQTMVRVRFKEGAAIEDVSLLKQWSVDWFDITRGAAMCVGESPQSIKVVGANNGSLIITLGTISSITLVLAIIAKNAGRVAREYLSIANIVEDLRHKKVLNKVIEKELVKKQEKIKEVGLENTVAEVCENISTKIDSEVQNLLEKAIKKYFNFYELGGDVDFIAPTSDDPQVETDDGENLQTEIAKSSEEAKKLITIIESVRELKSEIKQLEHDANAERNDL